MAQQVSERNQRIIRNSLNHLQGKDWLKFSKSWFVLRYPPRKNQISHPATFPEKLANRFIEFFTKENEWVFDPFAGSGSTLVAAKHLNRNSVGIELYPDYAFLARKRIRERPTEKVTASVIQGDSREIEEIFQENNFPKMNFCLTSPPYWNQLTKKTKTNERRQSRMTLGMKTSYGDNENDLGLIEDYNNYLTQLKNIFDKTYQVMATGSYLAVITNNVYTKGRLLPMAFDTFNLLSEKWTPKDEIIWCQDDKKLFPFGMFHSYIGNRSHHYCLIFKKSSD